MSFLLLAVLVIGSFAAAPMTAVCAEEEAPFQVTEQPVGDTYMLNDIANPISATFEYDALNIVMGHLYSDTPIIARWYWSLENSNTDRTNGFIESTVEYNRNIKYQTTHVPTTDTIGVRYYYAVLTYAVTFPPEDEEDEWTIVPTETVSDPARIEVVAPEAPGTKFEVEKVDEDGKPLAGAVFTLDPYKEFEDRPAVNDKSYEEKSGADGFAEFTVDDGAYILSEKEAPEGYEGSDDKYYIVVTPNGVYIFDPETGEMQPYETVTFVNKEAEGINPSPGGTSSQSGNRVITVKKVDGEDKPLAGAVIALAPDSSYDQASSVIAHESVTPANGTVTFSPVNGYYILSEKQAPSGYNATDDKYNIQVTSDGVFVYNPDTKALSPNITFVFVNKEIPQLNKDDHFAFMQGYPERDFRPDNNMTRAEAVVMFSRLLIKGMNVSEDHRNNFYPDVKSTSWYSNEVGYMQELGVLGDYSRDANFRPDEPVTRAEFATLAAHFDNLVLTDTNNFSDVFDDHWAVKYINSAAAKGWITGYPEGTFKPEDNISRAEVVTLVGRMLDRYADKEFLQTNADSLPRKYIDLKDSFWAYLAIMEASTGHDYVKDDDGEHWTETYE